MTASDRDDRHYECVEPHLGEMLWKYDDPDVAPALRAELTRHLEICDACRLQRDIERRVSAGLQDGSLVLAHRRPPRLPLTLSPRWGWATGTVMVAAAILLALLLPPTAGELGLIDRAGNDRRSFQRPIEGEVLQSARPTLSWNPIDEATSYQITVTEVGGTYSWQGETSGTSIQVPAAHALPERGRLRALLEPIPNDLAAAYEISVSFERRGWTRFLRYRISHSHPWSRWIAALGGVLLLGSAWLGHRRSGHPHHC